ncbi:hypothetical protein ACT7DA_24765 [Bacillus pacificus]
MFTESGQQVGDSYTTNRDGIVEAPNLTQVIITYKKYLLRTM